MSIQATTSQRDLSTNDTGLDAPRQPTLRELMRAHKAKEVAAQQPVVAEALEPRRHLTTVTTNLSGGILTINGTSTAEQISIGQSGDTIKIYDGTTQLGTTYTNAQVTNKIVVNSGGNDDYIRVYSDDDNLSGLSGSSSPVTEVFEINCGDGNDSVHGSNFADTIVGGNGNDTLNGFDGSDSIYGDIAGTVGTAQGLQTGYQDVLNGGDDPDQILGQFGQDTVNGDDGGDTLYGDFAIVTPGAGYGWTDDADQVNGGNGGDLICGDAASASGTNNTGGADQLNGDGDDDTIFGETSGTYFGGGNDTITGSNGADRLYGGLGNDNIDGGNDNDYLSGSSGNDTLSPGTGADSVFGDAGADSFVVLSDGEGDLLDGGADTDAITGSIDAGGLDTVTSIP